MTNTMLGEGGKLFPLEQRAEIPPEERLASTAEIIEGRETAHMAADDVLVQTDRQERERFLNAGCTRESVLEQGLCEQIKLYEDLKRAFAVLRRGYPDRPMSEQCQGREFRENAKPIISAVTAQTLQGINPAKAVVVLPWRAGLAFGKSYLDWGVQRFWHVSSHRDEDTLETIVDYEDGEMIDGDAVIIADPMLATGNTAVDAYKRILASGKKPGQVVFNAVVAAPVGVQNVNQFPGVKVVVGALDRKLDYRGYIEDGLGDFGNKHYDDLSAEEVHAIADALHMSDLTRQKLLARFLS